MEEEMNVGELLKEIAEVSAGQGAPQGDSNYCEDGIPFVKAGNLLELTEGKSIYGIQKVSEEVAKKHRLKLYKKGTILFAKSGMSCLKGYVYVLPCAAYVVSHLACVTPKEDISEYLKYYFCYHRPNQLVKDEAYPSISLSDIGCLEINTQDAAHRDMVVASLRKISLIIEMRKQQLAQLDNLIKARFVELFGDLASPECKWKVEKLVDACADPDDIKCGPFGTQLNKDEYQSDGVAVWEIPQINSRFSTIPTHYLSESKAKQLESYSIKPGDIAMSRKGNVGKCAVFPSDFEAGIIHSDVLRIRVDSRCALPVFMMHQLHYSRAVQHQIELVSSGAIMAGINVTKLKQICVHIPPLKLQEQFAAFVEHVDKSKVVVQNDIKQTIVKRIFLDRSGCHV